MTQTTVQGAEDKLRKARAKYSLRLGLWLFSVVSVANVSLYPAQGTKSRNLPALPAACQEHIEASKGIAEVLQVVERHPTAEGYNALGALFAQRGKLNCAIPAFREALRLDNKARDARYNLAQALIGKGEKTEAASQLQVLIEQQPKSAPAHNALGTLLQSEGKLEAAAEEFRVALQSDPHFAYAAYNLAQVLITQKRYPAAIFYLQNALKSSPPADLSPQLQVALGVAYAESGDSDQAIATLREAIKSHPDLAEAHFNLAALYAKRGPALGYQSAITEYKETLRIDPRDDEARLSLAKVLTNLGNFTDAIPYLKEYVRRNPQGYEGYHQLGTAYAGSNQLDQAAEALARAEKLKPRDYDIRYDLGAVLARMGRIGEAIAQLESAVKLNPKGAEAHYQLAMALRKKGDGTRSKQEMQVFQSLKAGETQETTAGNLNNEGNRLMAEGRVGEAAKAYTEAVRLDPTNAQWHYNLSLALSKLGDRGGERSELEKAIEIDPNMAAAHNQLGLACLAAGKDGDAEREFKVALEIDPRFAESQNNLGVIYSRQGKDPEAAELFRQATENDPKYTKAFVNLGLTLAKQGTYSGAQQQLQQALKLDPNDIGALTALGMVEAKMGHYQESVQIFKKVVSLNPDSAEARVNLGIALADQFDLKGALGEFTEATRLGPESAVAHYNEGRVLYDMDRRQEARPFLEHAVRLSPDYPAALYLLAVVLGSSPRSTGLLERLVALEPGNSDGLYLLGQNLLHQGKTQEGINRWKAAVAADPENSSALYNLARTLTSLHDLEAKQYMDRFQALERSRHLSDRVQSLNNFALEAANARNWPQAVEQLQEAIKLCGQCKQLPVLHRNLGLIYARKGDIERAKGELRLALAANPQDADAANALSILDRLQPPFSGSN
jgi:superkiller protein 3